MQVGQIVFLGVGASDTSDEAWDILTGEWCYFVQNIVDLLGRQTARGYDDNQ